MTYAGGMFLDLEKVLISKEKIAARVHDLAAEIARDIKAELGEDGGEKVVLVSVLTGSIVFVADLIRQLPLKLSLGLVAVLELSGDIDGEQGRDDAERAAAEPGGEARAGGG